MASWVFDEENFEGISGQEDVDYFEWESKKRFHTLFEELRFL